jgi:hypothetical protein
MFRMYVNTCKKESDTNEKLVRALERCDELDFEIERLRGELAEYQFYEYDLWLFFNFVLDALDVMEEELFKTKERIIEISIEKDHLFDANFSLEKQLYESKRDLRKLQQKYKKLSKLHSNCKHSIFLYRWTFMWFKFFGMNCSFC